MSIALLDTTLLSNFSHVQRSDLLRLVLGEQAATTPTVIAELRMGETAGFIPACDWDWLTVVTLTSEEQSLAVELQQQLDPGEAECLAVAQIRQYKFFSDDFAARRVAHQHNLTVSGTIGILLTLVNDKKISLVEGDYLLNVMISRGYRSPVMSLSELLS